MDLTSTARQKRFGRKLSNEGHQVVLLNAALHLRGWSCEGSSGCASLLSLTLGYLLVLSPFELRIQLGRLAPQQEEGRSSSATEPVFGSELFLCLVYLLIRYHLEQLSLPDPDLLHCHRTYRGPTMDFLNELLICLTSVVEVAPGHHA